jgi:hypothetical protein
VFNEGFYELFSLLEKQKGSCLHIRCHSFNTWANRVATVSSVITKIFNPCEYWTVMAQPSVYLFSVYSYLLPVFCYCSSVVWFSLISVLFLFSSLCLIVQCLIIWLFSVFSVLELELYSRYFDPITTTIQQVNKHYSSGIFGTNFSISGKWRARQTLYCSCSGPWWGSMRGSWERGRHFGGRGPRAPKRG